jgi:hypothetical protein
MSEKKVKIGFDRYLAKEWADYALGLISTSDSESQKYELLKICIQKQISGTDSARKTSNQLKRLWLNENDGLAKLRSEAARIFEQNPLTNPYILHLGICVLLCCIRHWLNEVWHTTIYPVSLMDKT